jgi:TspO/MBR family protein
VRSLRIGLLLVAIAICVLFALFGTALIGESHGNWYEVLDKPWFLIPLWAFGIVGAILRTPCHCPVPHPGSRWRPQRKDYLTGADD